MRQVLVFGVCIVVLCAKCCMGQYYYYYNYKLLLHPPSDSDSDNNNDDNDNAFEQLDDMTDPNDYNQESNSYNRSLSSNVKFVRMHKFDLQTAKAIARSLEAAQVKEQQQQQQHENDNDNRNININAQQQASDTTTITTDGINIIQTEATIIVSASI